MNNTITDEHLLRECGQRIIELRNQLGMTQAALSEVTGYSASYLSTLEHGKKNFTIDAAKTIATALNTSADFLMCESDNPSTTEWPATPEWQMRFIMEDFLQETFFSLGDQYSLRSLETEREIPGNIDVHRNFYFSKDGEVWRLPRQSGNRLMEKLGTVIASMLDYALEEAGERLDPLTSAKVIELNDKLNEENVVPKYINFYRNNNAELLPDPIETDPALLDAFTEYDPFR